MVDRRRIFGTAGRVELATERCDLSCDWCHFCRGRDIPASELRRLWSQPPPAGTPVLRIRGGDPFRYGDLEGWVAWARQEPAAAVCIEGPGAGLAAADRQEVIARLIAARPDAVAVVLPTIDAERTERLTGVQWDPLQAIQAVRQLVEAGVAVEIVFPVHPSTVDELAALVRVVSEELGGRVGITLRRAPSARDAEQERTDALSRWTELDGLSRALASLGDASRDRVALQMDPERGYAACMLQPAARRTDLFAANGRGGAAPLGRICDACAWIPHCTFRADHGAPARDQIHPLSAEDAQQLGQPLRPPPMGAEPRRFHTDRASLGLPNLLCLAPWTTLSVCEPRYHPVPCALSWVDSEMTAEEISAETGSALNDERKREHATRTTLNAPWNVMDNEQLSLLDLWNSPLLRLMRREMTGGEKSSRCRAMCRVVMGVEERGITHFQRPDDDYTPAVVANRRLLLEEIGAGKNILSAKPLDLVVGVSAYCNISCGFCDGPRGAWGDLSNRRRDEIIELLPTLMSFGVSGPGEPLMNKNFLTLLHHISDTGYPSLAVSLTTNGILLTPELLTRTRNVPWGSVRISLNAGSAETHKRMAGRDYFDRIMTNLDALCALRDRGPRPFAITLSFVLGGVQMGDAAKFAGIVHEHRTGIVVEPMYDNLRNLSPWIRPDRLPLLADELQSVADSYVDKNPDIARAFRAVEQFARARIQSGDYSVLKGH